MAIFKGKVSIDNRWTRYRSDLNRETALALVAAAAAGKEAAQRVPTTYRIDSIRSGIRTTHVFRTPRGPAVLIVDPDYRSRFFEKGTYQKLGGRSTRGAGGNRGVKPVHFMSRGRLAGRKVLLELLDRRLS